MPVIQLTSVQDLLKFIEDHRSDIENGTYDVRIERDWVPRLSEDTCHFLIKYSPLARYMIGLAATSRGILKVLVGDDDKYVRQRVALNPNVLSDISEELSKDTEVSVRRAIAGNPNTSTGVLEILCRDTDSNVRMIVASNPNTPPGILEILSKDRNADVCGAAVRNPNF